MEEALPIILLVVGAIGVAAIYTFVIEPWRNNRRRNHVITHGEDAIGWIVQANTLLFRPGGIDLPAQILLCFHPKDGYQDVLTRVAERLGQLKNGQAPNASEVELANEVKDERYRPTHRIQIPSSLTDGLEVWLADVEIVRKYLNDGPLDRPYIHCMAIPGNTGRVIMIAYPDEETTFRQSAN